jgi:hypothetical protein
MGVVMDHSVMLLTLASWIGCFWLGFQFGKGRSEQRRKHDVEDLERRFRIVEAEATNAPKTEWTA